MKEEMQYKQENFNKLSLADLIALHGWCEYWIDFYEKTKQEHRVFEYYGPLSCICMTEIGFRIAEVLKID